MNEAASAATAPRANEPLTSYQRQLLFFLSVATFFEGFDFFALAQLLPKLRESFGLDREQAGVLVGVINAGTILAAFLVRGADTWGRKAVLSLTIAGYTVCSVLTALAPNAWAFGLAQLAARVFLIGEWAVAMVYAAEEYPAARRATIIGIIQASSSLGGIACAGLVPLLLKTPLGWRAVYLAGAVPLLIVAYARRGLRETKRFETQGAELRANRKPFMAIWKTAHVKRLLLVGAIWALTYVGTHNAVTFWKEFAMGERGFTDAQVGGSLTIAALVAMPLTFPAGKLLDVLGRRMGAVVLFLIASAGVFTSYTLRGRWPLTAALMLGILGSTAVLPVLNAYTAELFPTEYRGDAYAWANNMLGRVGYVLSPLAVGAAAHRVGWGPAVAATALFPLLGLGLLLATLPETAGRELEETSLMH